VPEEAPQETVNEPSLSEDGVLMDDGTPGAADRVTVVVVDVRSVPQPELLQALTRCT
jgi:hypothetical protein